MVRQKESVLLTEWLAKFHRTSLQWKRVRLGVPANPKEAKYLMVTLRWADAVFIEDGKVYIIESKLRADPKAIGQLEAYKELFKVTPEFSAYSEWPVELILLAAEPDLATAAICSKKGIIFDIWKPADWK